MNIVGDLLRGHTASIVLSILSENDSYGYELNKTMERTTDGKLMLTEATLYTVFKRLEKNEYVNSYWKDGVNNVKRKYYSITEKGIEYLKSQTAAWIELEHTMKKFLKL